MNRLVILLVVAIPMYLISNLIEINVDSVMDFSSIQEANDNSGRLISSDIIIVDVTEDVINVPEDFTEIQTAIQQANADSTTIIVAPGEYHENLDFLGKNISLVSYFESTGDTTYINETIINGDSLGTVITISNCEQAEVIGFTITGGNGDYIPNIDNAGGLDIYSCQFVHVANLIFQDNTGTKAGLKCHISCLDLHDLVFRNNTGSELIIIGSSNSEFNNIDIYNNENSYVSMGGEQANISNIAYYNNDSYAGGISISADNGTISNINVENNYSGMNRTLSFAFNQNVFISNIVVRNNNAMFCPGLDLSNTSSILLDRLILEGNYSENGSQVLDLYCVENVVITNSLIKDNVSNGDFSLIFLSNSSVYIVNSTIVDNTNEYGGIINARYNSEFEPYLINTIIYGNVETQIQLGYPPTRHKILHVDHCNIQGGEEGVSQYEGSLLYWHEGNIDLPPEFMGEEPYPFSLSETSPCVDAGTTEFPIDLELPLTDLAGNERIWGDGIDMGCYEFGAPPYVENYGTKIEKVALNIENYPNPFNPETTISFLIPEGTDNPVVNIYNVKGQQVKKWKIDNVRREARDGRCYIVWDGRDERGNSVSSGIYFCRVKCGKSIATHRIMLIK